jgi:D-alanyl-D-alanine dipeptidase
MRSVSRKRALLAAGKSAGVRSLGDGRHRAPGLAAIVVALLPLSASASDLPPGFVYLRDVDPTIRQDMRYAGPYNFLGRAANGYEAPECILTEAAAKALAAVQKRVAAGGLTLVVFDCYRPARAVADFAAWVKEGGPPDPRWYPRTRRGDLIAQQYIASHSSHSRGSTVDLALAPADPSKPAAPDPDCGAEKTGTVAFGTGFDCLDPKSRTAFTPLAPEAIANRKTLVAAMQAEGFRNYSREWWHFSLKGEPFKQEFDFPVASKK